MRFISKSRLFLLSVLLASAFAVQAQQKVNAVTGIIWPAGCQLYNAATQTCVSAAGGGLPTTGGTMTGQIGFSGVGVASGTLANLESPIQSVIAFSGATADVKLAACLAVIPVGGICDARGFGATTQTIAATVTAGATYQQSLIFDPATVFQPAIATTTMFSFGLFAHEEGLSISAANQATYSVPAVTIFGKSTGAATDRANASIRDISVAIGNNYAGSMCLQVQGDLAVSYINVDGLSCYKGATGVQLISSGTGYITDNSFNNLNIVASTVPP